MKLEIYQVDAFASKVFTGNPAAICPLKEWLLDSTLQAIAEENNLSETAFFVPTATGFHLRWFTPNTEVELCGHATLAAAFVLREILDYKEEQILFETRSGKLIVTGQEGLYSLDFPRSKISKCETPEALIKALGKRPAECLKSEDYIAVFESEEEIALLKPDFTLMKELGLRGVIVTAKAKNYDFVSRFFAPKFAIEEDPVTGSSFTQLIPYWANKLGKTKLTAKQVSARGGEVTGELQGERVIISGRAVEYLRGVITF